METDLKNYMKIQIVNHTDYFDTALLSVANNAKAALIVNLFDGDEIAFRRSQHEDTVCWDSFSTERDGHRRVHNELKKSLLEDVYNRLKEEEGADENE